MTAPQQHETIEPTDRTGSPTETLPTEGIGSPTGMPQHAVESDSSADESLFADGEFSKFRSRWNDVQSGFVDDPRECVHQADALVADVVQQLTSGFSQARSRLEAQWERGEDVSTEDLRLALKRYRNFFERLLAV